MLGCLLTAMGLGQRSAYAQRELVDIPPPNPEEERAAMIVADGFDVTLFASDPLLAKPIQMNFDAQGRLWLATSSIYPHIVPGSEANDKILVLTDKDGDGRADETSVFAEGLLIPTGIEPGDGGAYVANSTELLHLKDTDGDGKADTRRIVLSGFGTEDTHHILHTLRWGHDGRLYFNQSIYIHSHIETPFGVKRLNGSGVWRMHTPSMQLEVFIKGLVNPWGHAFDKYGQSFGTDGAGGEGINYLFPGAVFVSSPGAARIMAGLNPGSPKYCGLDLVSGSHLPDDWQGDLITNDFRAHRVVRFKLADNGSGYSATLMPDVIRSTHVGFRPVDVKQGPDGAIYICDWYNPIIQHGEVDFRDPRRDHTHGRIWRLTAKDRPLVKRPNLVDASDAELAANLASPEGWTRHFSRRVLQERGPSTAPAVQAWIDSLATGPESWQLKLEGLWTLQALDLRNLPLLNELLVCPEPQVRAAAVRILSDWKNELPNSIELLAAAVRDEHPRVRLEAVRALGQIPTPQAANIAARALDKTLDGPLDFALWTTVRELEPQWLPAATRGESVFDGSVEHLIYAFQAVGSPSVVRPLLELLSKGEVPADRRPALLALIAKLGDANELQAVLAAAAGLDPAQPDAPRELLTALRQAFVDRGVVPNADLNVLQPFLNSEDSALRGEALQLAGLWRVNAFRPAIAEAVSNEQATVPERLAAVRAMAGYLDDDSRAALVELCQGQAPWSVRQAAVVELAKQDLATAGPLAAALLNAATAEDNPEAALTVFLQHEGGAAVLAESLQGKTLHADVAKMSLRVVRSSPLEHAALDAAIKQAGGLTAEAISTTPENLTRLLGLVVNSGDATRGEQIFRRADLACMKCHAIGGAGGQVGPDITSIGASAQPDYLLDSILLPNKAVKENYHAITVSTTEGEILSGIKVRETERELVLRDAEDREKVISKSSIDEQGPANSLMPAGLPEFLTEPELVDLVKFLTELGRKPEFSLKPEPRVRRWEVLLPTQEALHVLRRTSFDSAALTNAAFSWQPVYSKLGGQLPLADAPVCFFKGPFDSADVRVAFVRFAADVQAGGQTRLKFGSVQGLKLWIDGQPAEISEEVAVDLAEGRHAFTLSIDLTARQEPLECLWLQSEDSQVRLQWVLH